VVAVGVGLRGRLGESAVSGDLRLLVAHTYTARHCALETGQASSKPLLLL